MIKRYRAYDETIDKWRYFTINANIKGWELTCLHKRLGDHYDADEDTNFKFAYDNMLKIIEQLHLTKLTEISETEV